MSEKKSVTTFLAKDVTLAPEHAERIVKPMLTDGSKKPVSISFGEANQVSDDYVDAFFTTLMRSGMALGGRRMALEWQKRMRVPNWVGERAHRAMAKTLDLDLRFGMLAPPLASQAGCRPDLLEHEQQDADCVARLGARGIASYGEVHKMRQRLVKRIVKAVKNDGQPQTVSGNDGTGKTASAEPEPAGHLRTYPDRP